MDRYRAVATRSGGWWALEVPDHPGVFTQARRLDQAAGTVADALSLWLDDTVTADQVEVEAHAGEFDEAAEQVRDTKAAAEQAREDAATAMRTAVLCGVAAGLPHRDIGVMLGVSHQRVGAIAREFDRLPAVGDFGAVSELVEAQRHPRAPTRRRREKVSHG